ncbi:MAG: response regulator [bacterium]|nr:response regulator [bacterium]
MPKTLLLADDSVTIQKVVGISFANEDVELVTVDNGDDAVARARELRPDLVLADVVMPGLSGYEVCHAIKSDPALSAIPVLLLTGTFETFDEAQASEVGADGHITKPFEAQALVDQVNTLLASSPAAAAPAIQEEPEPLGLTGLVTPGAGTEPYDLFEDDVTAPSGTADDPAFDNPPTTVLVGGEALGETGASGPQAPISGDDASFGLDANAQTADEFAAGSDLFSSIDAPEAMLEADSIDAPETLLETAPIEDPEGGTVLLDPVSGGTSIPDLLADDDDVLESGEPIADAPLITSEPDVLQAPIAAAAGQGSADLFGVSEPSGVSDSQESVDPLGASGPVGGTDPQEMTMLLAEPPPAPDAPTAFEFGDPSSPESGPTADSNPSFAAEPAPLSGTEPAGEADLFADEISAPAPSDLLSGSDSPEVPDLFDGPNEEPTAAKTFSDPEPAPFPGLLDEDDPTGQTTLDPEVGRDYDVSSSDLGASSSGPPSPALLPSEPNWPADPEAAETTANEIEVEPERHEATPPALSPILEQQIHDAVEKMAWDSFGDLAERIVKDAVDRIERVAWEVIPQMAETLIQEEIRKLKDGE